VWGLQQLTHWACWSSSASLALKLAAFFLVQASWTAQGERPNYSFNEDTQASRLQIADSKLVRQQVMHANACSLTCLAYAATQRQLQSEQISRLKLALAAHMKTVPADF